MHFRQLILFCSIPACISSLLCSAAEPDPYTDQVKPLLRTRCYACHGTLKAESGLRLDSGKLIRQGGENGSILDFDDIPASELIQRVSANDPEIRMPPDGPALEPAQVDLLAGWIRAGAEFPADEQPETPAERHWAFQTLQRPTVPASASIDLIRNPIDAFIQTRQKEHGLKPVTPARPEHLLRRVALDLTGLPPTVRQVQEFQQDPSDVAYRRFVDQLLDSPQYGERWARHWMDIWRYSDWYGRRQQNDVRNSAPQIWRWRDWIVQSLNEDRSYARMIEEMLAADELAPRDDSAWPATGYLVRNYYSLNPNEWMRHNVEYTAKAFLGLTINCAHCHDHKYDPVSQEDYFRFRAFFEPLGIRQDQVVGEAAPPPFQPYTYAGSRKVVRLGMVRVFDENPEAPTWFYSGGDERNRNEERGIIAPGVPGFLGVPFPEILAVNLPMEGWYPGARPNLRRFLLEQQRRKLSEATAGLQTISAQPDSIRGLRDAVAAAEGDYRKALREAREQGETVALSGEQSLLIDASEGRRIVHHPLTDVARIADGTVIRFRLKILQDAHVNFQLARDTTKHLTALYVGFIEGRILAYQPGGFSQFETGQYSLMDGQSDLEVTLILSPSTDTAALSVKPAKQDELLVDAVPIALNGWNASRNPHQPLTFDCRTGTRVMIDDVFLQAGKQEFRWDFEAPKFPEGQDACGLDGWFASSSSVNPAFSIVTALGDSDLAWPAHQHLLSTRNQLIRAQLPRTIAERSVESCRDRLAAIEATIAADDAEARRVPTDIQTSLNRKALLCQRRATETEQQLDVLQRHLELLNLQQLPPDDKSREKKVVEARKQLSEAKESLQKIVSKHGSDADGDDSAYQRLSQTTRKTSTGRRAALARWITDRRNPLTARVAVNHIWMRHFHVPLVESVYDFGRNGKAPTHPRLLDWLAVELRENAWSMKRLHRLIVTSQTYRMSSSVQSGPENRELDRDNRWLWRMNSGRMESEAVRDSVLSVSRQLDLKQGGQSLPNTESERTFRRSLYYEFFPEDGGVNSFGEVFDPADPVECFRRTTTIIPQQALALSNSELIHQASKHLAGLIDLPPVSKEFVKQAFLEVLSREPDAPEMAACLSYLRESSTQDPAPVPVRAGLIRVLFNHHEFVSIP